MNAPVLLAIAVLLFAISAAAVCLVLRGSTEDKEIQARLESVSTPARARAIPVPSLTKKDREADAAGVLEQVTGLFGFSLAKAEMYTMKWYLVVGIGLVVGRIAVLLASGLFGGLAWALLPVVTVAVCRSMFGTMIMKRINKLRAQFPDALGLVVRAVRVGVPVSEALRAVAKESMAPTAKEFELLADQIAIGTPMEVALRAMAERNSLPEYGFFAAALALQAQTGGGLAETLELLAEVTRKRVAMQARGHALSAEARTSSMILGGLPVAAGLGLWCVNSDYMGVLFFDDTGRMILGAAILSEFTGMFVMRTIIRKSLAA